MLLSIFVCCVILASVAVFLVFAAWASAGPDLNLRFLYLLFGRSSKTAFIQDRQPHGNGIGGLKFRPFLSFFIPLCRLTWSARLEGGKIPRVGSHTCRLAYSGTVCWLAGRQTTTIPNREGKHTGMQVAALLPADVGLGHGGSRIERSLWRNSREDPRSSLWSY